MKKISLSSLIIIIALISSAYTGLSYKKFISFNVYNQSVKIISKFL